MKFKKLKIENFLSYEKASLSFESGLHLISGWNKDLNTCNGSGKSAIVDAICYGLFGELPRKVSADSIVNWKKNKKCLIELHIEDGDIKYKVIRGRKPAILDFWINSEKISGISTSETQAIIEKKLGITYDLFMHSVYFAQNSQIQFVSANDNTKKDLLTELLNLEVFDRIHEKIKEEIRSGESSIELSQNRIQMWEHSLTSTEESIKNYKALKERFKISQDQKITRLKDTIEAEQREKLRSHSNLGEQTERLMKETTELGDKRKTTEEEKTSCEREVERVRERDSLNYEESQALNEELSQMRVTQQEKINSMSSYIGTLNTKIEHMSVDINNNIKELKRIEELGVGKCPTCYQEISKELLLDQRYRITNDVRSRMSVVQGLGREISQLMMEKKEAEELGIKLIQEQNQKIEENKKKRQNISLELNSYQQKWKQIDSLLTQLTIDQNKKKLELDMVSEKVKNLEETYRKRIVELETQISHVLSERNDYDELIVIEEKKIRETNLLIELGNKDIIKIQEEIEYRLFLKDAFGNRGVKSYVFEQVVGEINVKSNEYLSYLFDSDIEIEFKVKDTTNTKGEVKHKFETRILYQNEEKEFGLFSGGEKRRIILAVDLAISQIIQNRSMKNINLLILDEYFTGLDFVGSERMMDLLKQIEEETTILVVDHNTQFQNLFSRVIEVEKSDGISTIVG